MSISEISADTDYTFELYSTEIEQETSGLPQPEELETSAGRYVLISSDEKRAQYKVDDCLRINTPSDLFRINALKAWRETRSSAGLRAWVSLGIFGLSCGAFAITAYTAISAAAGVFALANSLALFYQAADAQRQIDLWQVSQVEWVAGQRKLAYRDGFIPVYQSASLSKLLLPFEVVFLFNRYFDRFFNSLLVRQCNTEAEKKGWVEQFIKENPISPEILRHVYGSHIPRSYSKLSVQFKAIVSSLQEIREEFKKIRQEKRSEHDQWLKRIENERAKLVQPLDRLLQTQIQEARKTRDEEQAKARMNQLNAANNRPQLEAEAFHEDLAIKKYEDAIYAARKTHESLITPIQQHFDAKREEAKQALKSVEQSLEAQETNALNRYYSYARSLAEASLNAKNPEFDEIPLFVPVVPSAPPAPEIQLDYVGAKTA